MTGEIVSGHNVRKCVRVWELCSDATLKQVPSVGRRADAGNTGRQGEGIRA